MSDADKVLAILADVEWRWSVSTNDAVRMGKVRAGERGPLPRRSDLITWDDVPRELWGEPAHWSVSLLDPQTLMFICAGRHMRLVEILQEGGLLPPAEEPERPRHWRRRTDRT